MFSDIDNYFITKSFTWLIFFGLTSIFVFFLSFKINHQRQLFYLSIITFLEILSSSVSSLSRGFILNASSILFSWFKLFQFKLVSIKLLMLIIFSASLFMVINVLATHNLRGQVYQYEVLEGEDEKIVIEQYKAKYNYLELVVNRWVGLDSYFAVYSKLNQLSIDTYRMANKFEKENKTSFFDYYFLNNPYHFLLKSGQGDKRNFMTTPGVVAYSFYSGSIIFALLLISLIVIFCYFLEYFINLATNGNFFIIPLFMQIITTRLMHFGYAPENTIIFLITILFNIMLLCALLSIFKKK